MTSNIQQLREKIPLYLNGSLSEQQASEFRQLIGEYPELEKELAEFSAIDDTFAPISMPDEQQFDSMFNEIETKIDQDLQKPLNARQSPAQNNHVPLRQNWPEKFRDLLSNPFVAWGVALAQFALVAVLVFQIPTEENDISYQTLSVDTPQKITSIIVVFAETATLAQLNGLMLKHQLEIISGPGPGKAYRLHIKQEASLEDIIQQLRQSDIVRFAEQAGAE